MQGECLECHIADRRVGVPVDAIEQIADLAVLPPPPLAASWLTGLAMHRGQVVPLVDAVGAGAAAAAAGTRVRCLVVRAGQDNTAFAVSVTRVLHLLRVDYDDADAGQRPLVAGRDASGASIAIVRPAVIEATLHADRAGGRA